MQDFIDSIVAMLKNEPNVLNIAIKWGWGASAYISKCFASDQVFHLNSQLSEQVWKW